MCDEAECRADEAKCGDDGAECEGTGAECGTERPIEMQTGPNVVLTGLSVG